MDAASGLGCGDCHVRDGALLATPAGSTAYNLSAHGPIVPIGAPLLALTPISAFRPRRWPGGCYAPGGFVELPGPSGEVERRQTPGGA